MKMSEIVEKTGLEALSAWEDGDIPGVYVSDMASDIITGAPRGCVLLTLQTHKNLIAAANLVDAGMVVFAHGKRPADDVLSSPTGSTSRCSARRRHLDVRRQALRARHEVTEAPVAADSSAEHQARRASGASRPAPALQGVDAASARRRASSSTT